MSRYGPYDAKLGGYEYVIGGWGAAVVEARRIRWDLAHEPPYLDHFLCSAHPKHNYPDRSFITNDDIIESILRETFGGTEYGHPGGGRDGVEKGRNNAQNRHRFFFAKVHPLIKALRKLAKNLGHYEDRLCEPDSQGVWECASLEDGLLIVPALTSADLWDLVENPQELTDAENIYRLALDMEMLMRDLGLSSSSKILSESGEIEKKYFAPLDKKIVYADDAEGILDLERTLLPTILALEAIQARIISNADSLVKGLKAKESTGPKPLSLRTRSSPQRFH